MGKSRLPSDTYQTPPALCTAICERILQRVPLQTMLVVEPQAGAGNFVRAVRAEYTGPVVAVELYSQYVTALTSAGASTVICADFLTVNLDITAVAGAVLFIGNPPYATAEAHVRRALALMRTGDTLAYLMRMAFLCSQGRARGLYREYPLAELHPVAERPAFGTKRGHSDNSEYGVFVWVKGHEGPAAIHPHIWWHVPPDARIRGETREDSATEAEKRRTR